MPRRDTAMIPITSKSNRIGVRRERRWSGGIVVILFGTCLVSLILKDEFPQSSPPVVSSRSPGGGGAALPSVGVGRSQDSGSGEVRRNEVIQRSQTFPRISWMGNRGLEQDEGAEHEATRGFDVVSISMNVKMRKK
jgi:hypothetical protein